jgi:hypothetical protein
MLNLLVCDSTFLEEVRDVKGTSRDMTGKIVWSRARGQPARDLSQIGLCAEFLDQVTAAENAHPGRPYRYQFQVLPKVPSPDLTLGHLSHS